MKALVINYLIPMIASLLFPYQGHALEQWTKEIRKNAKPSIVNIFTSLKVGLDYEIPGSFSGTGSVVDAKRGIILTNKHVTGTGPQRTLEVSFSSGEAASAKLIYFHPWHDFAFIQVDPKLLSYTKITEVILGDFSTLEEGDEVLQIGNTESNPYSMSKLEVSNLFRNQNVSKPSYRHTHLIHLSGVIAGGASGSPIFNRKGNVIALLNSGMETQTYALRIDYVKDVLTVLQKGEYPSHGDLLVQFDAPEIKNLFTHYPPNRHINSWLSQAKSSKPAVKNYIMVKSIIPESPASKKLQVGDIVMGVHRKENDPPTFIGNNLYLLDQLVDQQLGKSIFFRVFRAGQMIENIEIPVQNASQFLVNNYCTFGHTTFHNLDANIALFLGIPLGGVYISEAIEGKSAFASILALKYRSDHHRKDFGKRSAILSKIDHFSISSMKDFEKAIGALSKSETYKTLALFRDYLQYYPGLRSDIVTLDFETDSIQCKTRNIDFQWK
ncbi:MAG: trypsin-like peptidase domain-containing protein [Bdellovibrionales bacterium]|nr:trypsin-like peptidase domain-containing protein [Bdellovibrionales bacterium]